MHAGHAALESLHHVSGRNVCHVLHLDYCNGTGQVGFLLSHISGNDYFIKEVGVIFKNDLEFAGSIQRNWLHSNG